MKQHGIKQVMNILGASLCLLAGLSAAAPKWISYPSSKRPYPSVDGRYELYNVNYDGRYPAHTLFLKDKSSGRVISLFSYARAVDALWSPVGSRLLVTDYGGSDFSNVLIYVLDKAPQPIDIQSELRKKMTTDRDIFENDHVYIEASSWIDQDNVKIKINGHGELDRGGFTIWVTYKLGDGFNLISKHRTKAD